MSYKNLIYRRTEYTKDNTCNPKKTFERNKILTIENFLNNISLIFTMHE